MADNPIKYSDFIQPDESISGLIKQLEQVQSTYSKMRDDIVNAAKELESAMKKVNNTSSEGQETTKRGATEAERLSKSYDALKQSQSETAKQLANLKIQQQEQNNINKLTAKLNSAAEGSYNRLSAQYSLNKIRLNQMSQAQRQGTTTGQQLEKSTKAIYEEMNRLQKATGKSQLQVGQYERGLYGMSQQFTMMPGPMGRVVTGFRTMTMAAKAFIATPVGIILAAFVTAGVAIKKLISTASGFEAQMDKVQAITGASATEMYHLSKSAKDLGRTTTKTAVEVGELQTELAKLGFTTTEILDATDAIIALSEATKEDLARSATVAASTIRGFGLDAAETQRVADVMAMSFNKSALDLGKFETAMAQIAPVAKTYDVSLERSTAMLGVLSDAGLDASTAGTSLRNIFLELSKQGLTFEQAMQKINSSQDKAGVSLELFGKRGAVAGLVIADNLTKIDTLTESLENAEGAVNRTADTMKDNLQGDVTALKSAWEGLFLSVEDGGGVLTKIGRFFVQILTKILNAMANFKQWYIKNWNDMIEQSRIFRLSIVAIESVFKVTFGNIATIIKSFVGSLLGVGKIIKSIFTGDLEGARVGWDKIKNSFVNGFVEVGQRAKDVGVNIANAYTGKNMDKYMMKSGKVVKELERQSGAVGIIGEEIEDAYEGGTDAANKAAKEQVDIEKRKSDLLYEIQEEGYQKELDGLERNYSEKKKMFISYGLDLVKLEEWKNKQIESINKKYRDKEESDRLKVIETEKAESKKRYDSKVNHIEDEFDLRMTEIDLLKTTEAEKTRLRMEAEKDRLKKILKLNTEGESQLSAIQIQSLKNTIQAIDQEIEKSKKDSFDIYSMVGLKLDDDQKAAIEESTAFAIDQVQNFLQAKVDAAQAAVDAANVEVEASQKKLDAEIEARNNGYASNVTMAQKEFELAKKNQEKALKEQEKAQKAQKAIDTLQQVSSLVTATAGIWKSFAGTGPWGVALAIAGTALMWGSFAAAKIKAAQITKKEYGEGGLEFLSGGSHASGNDIPLGYTKDGKDRRAEGGEALAIIRKSQARKYRHILPEIISALNKGTFEQKYMGAYETGGLSIGLINSPSDLKALENDVRAIKEQGERRYFTDGKGNIIETYKNLRRIYNAN